MSETTNKRLGLLLPLIVFIALVPVFFFALNENKEEIPSPLIGKIFPDFLLTDLSGEQVIDKHSLLGKPFLLNVWGSWCPSCYVEHPFLEELSQKGVRIVGLNYKDKRDAAKGFLERLGNPYAIIIYDEKGELGLDLGVYGAPETYLIGSNGEILFKRVGVLDERIWKEQFAPLLKSHSVEGRSGE
jgi:cytochrome c biogenesis protein CcmG/thiol:disulfide interchange protein DsbE